MIRLSIISLLLFALGGCSWNDTILAKRAADASDDVTQKAVYGVCVAQTRGSMERNFPKGTGRDSLDTFCASSRGLVTE